jgi:hypothetical protein
MTEEKDNSVPVEKKPEQEAAERLERYQKNPDTFIEIDEIVFASVRNPKSRLGISIFIGNARRMEIDVSWAEMNHAINKSLLNMDIEGAMKQQSAATLVKPMSHGVLNFARGRRN